MSSFYIIFFLLIFTFITGDGEAIQRWVVCFGEQTRPLFCYWKPMFNWLSIRKRRIGTIKFQFNPIQDGLFRRCSRMGEGAKRTHSLKSVTHTLQWWNLARFYLTQKRSKKNSNHVTHPLSSADISIFSPQISKLWYIKKYRYRLYFDT